MSNKLKVLITGGTGLIGSFLSKKLREEGHEVFLLSRSKKQIEGITKVYQWDIKRSWIEEGALAGKDIVIHLAGENIGEQAWTSQNRKRILESRTRSTDLLVQELKKESKLPKKILCASAIGFYGSSSEKVFTEQDGPGVGFAAEVTKQWELATDQFRSLGISCSQVRIGIVLSTQGGAMPQMMLPTKLFIGAPIGSGKQRMSWIHLEDLVDVFMFLLAHNVDGKLNAVAPQPVSNSEFMKALRKAMGKFNLAPSLPAFVLRLVMGERADLVLNDQVVSSQKLQDLGFQYNHESLEQALKDLLISSL